MTNRAYNDNKTAYMVLQERQEPSPAASQQDPESILEVELLWVADRNGKIKPGDIIKFVCHEWDYSEISEYNFHIDKRYIKKGIDVSFNLGMFDECVSGGGSLKNFVFRLENGNLVRLSGECLITKTTEKEKKHYKKIRTQFNRNNMLEVSIDPLKFGKVDEIIYVPKIVFNQEGPDGEVTCIKTSDGKYYLKDEFADRIIRHSNVTVLDSLHNEVVIKWQDNNGGHRELLIGKNAHYYIDPAVYRKYYGKPISDNMPEHVNLGRDVEALIGEYSANLSN